MKKEPREENPPAIPKPNPPRKIYLEIHDLFAREFNWPEQILRFPNKKIRFKLNYKTSFDKNLKEIKKRFKLTDNEIDSFKNYETEFIIHQLESTNYEDKTLLNEIYGKEFFFEDTSQFIPALEYMIKHAERLNGDSNTYDEERNFIFREHRLLINVLVAVCFEYACKGLLLSKNYKINDYKIRKKPIRTLQEMEIDFNLNRTISLSDSWNSIKEKKLMNLSEEEILLGNFICFSRNRQIHTPSLMNSRGNYDIKCISLVKRILSETKNSFYWKKFSKEK